MTDEQEGLPVGETPPQSPAPPAHDVAFSFEDMAPPAPESTEQPRYFEPSGYRSEPPPQAPPDQQAFYDQVKAQFNEELAKDPANALVKAAILGAQLGAQASAKKQEEAQGDINRQAIENFKSKMAAANPQIWKAVSADFESHVTAGATPEYLQKVSTSQLINALGVEFDAAKGRALDRVLAKPKPVIAPAPAPAQGREVPPSYGGAGSGGGAPTAIKITNDRDREMVEMARIADLSDEDIADLLS